LKSIKSTVLDKAYKDERDADVRERILLVIRVLSDNQHIESVAHEIHRSRSWAYKWYMRYNYDQGIEGLKDQPRSGRPYVYSTTTIILRCFIVRIWLRLDSNRLLHEYLSLDLHYNKKVMKACGLSRLPLPNRRTFDRRLKTISTDIKERIIATMGHLFVSEGIVKPYITAIDSTLLLSRLEIMYGTNHL